MTQSTFTLRMGFLGSSAGKESICSAGDPGLIPNIRCKRDGLPIPVFLGFSGGSDGKESACKVGDLSSIPGLGRYSGEGNSYPLQYSGLENSMDREAWHATIQGLQSPMQLTNFHFHFSVIEIRKNLFP